MGITAWLLVIAALTVAAAVLIDAARHPILARMASRNGLRRPKQTATVIAGLMVGTAIISASLVAGQSAGSAIREAVYETLGEVDETVRTEGFYFFPEAVAMDIIDDPSITEFMDGAAPFLLWDAAADHPDGLFEPSVRVFGYDTQRDADFGDFELTDGTRTDGSGLRPGDAIITEGLADSLDAGIGDRISLTTTLPTDPLLPDFAIHNGVLFGAAPTIAGLPATYPTGLPSQATHPFDVALGAKQISIILLCGEPEQGCPTGSELQLETITPTGEVFRVPTPPSPQPTTACGANCGVPVQWLNVTTEPAEVLSEGEWQVRITATQGAQTPYVVAALVLRPVYDLDELATRSAALEQEAAQLFDDLDLDFFGDRSNTEVRVVGITDGGRGRLFDFDNAVFMPLGDAQQWLDREGQVNFIKFSNPGTVETGGERTDEAEQRINATLMQVAAAYPGLIVIEYMEINPVKSLFLDLADEAGELMTSLLIFAGSLTIITGLLLIINIFTMLAEERRSELGMARAVGLRRSDVVRLFLFEGSLYAVAAAAIGSVLGLGLAYGLIAILNDILIRLDAAFPPIPFQVPAWVLPVAFAAGLLLTFITIAIASGRQSRLNIVRAIRQIEEPQNSVSPWAVRLGGPLAAIGLAAAITGWIVLTIQIGNESDGQFPAFSFTVFGPLLIGIGAMMGLRGRFKRSRLDTTVALLLAAYYIVTIFVFREFPNIREANIVGPIRGVLMTLGIVLAVSNWRAGPRLLGRLMGRIQRLRAVAIPAVSYPQHKRFRTGMTLAMFSIVILSIGFFSIFGGLFDIPAERQTGGFHIEARTTLDVPGLAGYETQPPIGIQTQHRLLDHFSFEPAFITVSGGRTGQFGEPGHHVFGVDQAFIEDQEFKLLWTLDDLSQEATYQRLLDEPGTVIAGYPYSTDERNQDLSHEVGEELQIHLGDCTVAAGDCPTYTIIGIQEQYHHLGIFLPAPEVARLFPQAEALYLFKVDRPDDAPDLAKELERTYRSIGMDAEPSVQLVEKEQEGFRQILAAMKLFLSLGLIVGVLSLGIVTSRSVLERRQEIGMLRALGFTRRQVRRIFLIEVSMVIMMGFIIGFICSVIVTYGLWFAVIRELQYPYTIPWLEILYLFAASYVVAMMATIAPILRVGKVAPAEALRYLE